MKIRCRVPRVISSGGGSFRTRREGDQVRDVPTEIVEIVRFKNDWATRERQQVDRFVGAGCKDEWSPFLDQGGSHLVAAFADQMYVEQGNVECIVGDGTQCGLFGQGRTDRFMAHVLQPIRDHHGDQRLVFDDQYLRH